MTKHLSLEQIVACGVENSAAAAMLPQLNQWLSSLSAAECWQCITREIFDDCPFPLHQLLYEITFDDWENQGPAPAWFPSKDQIQATNIAAVMDELKIASYPEFHAWSIHNRPEFWKVMIQRLDIRFQEKYTKILDIPRGVEFPRWLVSARFNIVESCFQALESDLAIVFQPEGGSLRFLSYGELNALSNRVANGLVASGFSPGDRLGIDLPMTAESIAIYLGIIKAGCIVISIADSFAADEIATRLRISEAKGIFTQDYIQRAGKNLPLYAKVVDAGAPKTIVLASGSSLGVELRPGDIIWEDFLSPNEQFNAVPASSDDYTNILFSSGTTGEPKVIPWTHTTPLKCAVDGHLHHDIHPGEVVAWPTNLGWMMGPWLIYASLINRATIALYYGAPTKKEFGQFVQNARVNMLGLVPTLVSVWKATGCMQGFDWSAIKAFSSSGECSNPQDMLFLMSLADYRPIVEYCGGTEIGGGYLTGTLVQPCAPAAFTTPALGLDLVILDENGHHADKGEVFIIPPSIGLSTELLNRDHHQVYYADTPQQVQSSLPLRRHGDRIERFLNGFYRASGRVDDTMNLGGIKVSSTEIEKILNTEVGIHEAAAIAVSPQEGGPSQLVVYAVATLDARQDHEALKAKLQAAIRQYLNPLFKIHELAIVETLPRTASNKIMRRVLRDRYRGAR